MRPMDNLPLLNMVKAGRAVPVRFSLNGDQGLDIFPSQFPASQEIDCDSGTATGALEPVSTAGTSALTYDPGDNQYSYIWKTSKKWAGTCRQLDVKLKDGTNHRANFKFVK
jgi:hypothetical protein